MSKAKAILEKGLEESDDSCFVNAPKKVKIQFLALQLTISQAIAELEKQPEETRLWNHKEWPYQIHYRAKTLKRLLEVIRTYFPELEKQPEPCKTCEGHKGWISCPKCEAQICWLDVDLKKEGFIRCRRCHTPDTEFIRIPCPDCSELEPLTPFGEQEAIKEAIKAIEQRKQGRYKLVYDKSSRTIIAVSNPNYSFDCKPEPKKTNRVMVFDGFGPGDYHYEDEVVEPEPCKTCDGSGRKKWTVTEDWPHEYTICPDCKPEPSEFTQECREVIIEGPVEHKHSIWVKRLLKACAIIDTLTTKLTEAEEENKQYKEALQQAKADLMMICPGLNRNNALNHIEQALKDK